MSVATGMGGRRILPQWLALALALLLLNGLLTFHNVWPTPWIRPVAEGSLELVILVLALALYAEWRGVPGRIARAWLAGLLLLLVVGRYADVTAPALFGRPIHLYWDAPHLPHVVAMLARVTPIWTLLAGLAGIVIGAGALYLLLRGCSRTLTSALHQPLVRRSLAVTATLLIALFAVGAATPRWSFEHLFASPVTPVYWQQARFAWQASRGDDRVLPPPPAWPSDSAPPWPGDVFVVFVESYGMVAFDDSAIAVALAPRYRALEGSIAAAGRGVVSAALTSPTFGGSSWLAHASLLAGIEVADEGRYKALLATQRETLSRYAQARGYRAVALMPGLRQEWPEGQFHRFDRLYSTADLDYRGPAFGWWAIPDQYSLARLHALEVAPSGRKPLFVLFPTISSHVPFLPVPAYQSAWERVLTASPFADEEVIAALARQPDWNRLKPAYTEALAYELTWLAGYLRGWALRDALFVVLGDHQPAASVSGAGARWDVPVHVIGATPALARSLTEKGFAPGLTPPREPVGKLHELGGWLLGAGHATTTASAP